MTFTIYTHNKGAGWVQMGGTFVFPFSFAEKLDEALDEAEVVCYNSNVKEYKPNTPVKVVLSDGTNTREILYKISNDISEEYPNGSATYKHTLSLVEMTKYLEGVMCQTLTFTNKNLAYPAEEQDATEKITGNNNATSYTTYFNGHRATLYNNYPAETKPKNLLTIGQTFSISPYNIFTAISNTLHDHYGFNYIYGENEGQSYINYSVGGKDPAQVSAMEFVDATISEDTDPIFIFAHIEYAKETDPNTVFTNDFTFSVLRTQSFENARKMTIKDVCDRIFDLCEPLYGNDTPRFSLSTTDATDLDKIIAPEFTMSQSNLREQLKVVGSRIHAEPRIRSIAWNNSRWEYVIGFDYYSTQKDQTLPLDYLLKRRTYSLANYITRIHTNARNVVNSLHNRNTVTDPVAGGYKATRAEQTNVRITESNAICKTAFPIYDIISVKCGIYEYTYNPLGTDTVTAIINPHDITKYVKEATVYDSLLSTYSNSYPFSKATAIRWKRGESNITQLFYEAPNAISQALSAQAIANILSEVTGYSVSTIQGHITNPRKQLVFQVQYKPVTNSAFYHGKNKYSTDEQYTTAYNQSDTLVEMDYYGENIRGAAARLGNAELSVTATFTDLANLPKLGYRTTVNDEEYYISTITSRMEAERITSTIGLTKDFNRISQYIGINSQKRISEISTDQTYDRDVILETKLIVGRRQAITPKISKNIDAWACMFIHDYGDQRITQALVSRMEGNAEVNPVCLPAIASGYGTTTVLTTSMKDNFAAGEGEQYYPLTLQSTNSGFYQKDVRFGDYFGRAGKINLDFGNAIDTSRMFAITSPKTSETHSTAASSVYTRNALLLKKDNRERLANISIAIEAQTTIDGVTLGSAISKLNGLVHYETPSRHAKMYLIFNDSELPYKLDDDIIDYDRTNWESVDISVQTHAVGLHRWFTLLPYTYTGNKTGIGFVIAYPVTSTTITEGGQTQTVYSGGEIVLIAKKAFGNGDTLLGSEYSFYFGA